MGRIDSSRDAGAQALRLADSAGVAKRGKDRASERTVVHAHFRVPLNAQRKLRGRLDRYCFDQAIWRPRFDAQSRTQPVYTLMVQGVDHDRDVIGQLREAPAWDDLDLMAILVPAFQRSVVLAFPMIETAGLFMDCPLERAAENDIEFLKAATDAKEGHARFESLWQQRKGNVVAGEVDGDGRGQRRRTVALCRDIGGAAGQQKTVDRVDQRFIIHAFGVRRDDDGKYVRNSREGMHIAFENAMRRVLLTLKAICHDGNNGFVGIRVIHFCQQDSGGLEAV